MQTVCLAITTALNTDCTVAVRECPPDTSCSLVLWVSQTQAHALAVKISNTTQLLVNTNTNTHTHNGVATLHVTLEALPVTKRAMVVGVHHKYRPNTDGPFANEVMIMA